MIQSLSADFPRYSLAAFCHRTETDDRLTFDAATAWQVPIFQDHSDQIVIQKCSQVGITVWAIIDMIWLLSRGIPGIYVLPTDRAMYTFVKNRIDPILRAVPYYQKNYAPHRQDASGSELKTLFNRRVKFAGSQAEMNFYEFPAGWYTVDEFDLCDKVNLDYLNDRLGRAKVKITRRIGNPRTPKKGINKAFLASDQKEWTIQCQRCNEWQALTWEGNCVRQVDANRYVLRDRTQQRKFNDLTKQERPDVSWEILVDQGELTQTDARVYCQKCQKPIDRHSPGEWVPAFPDRVVSGYQINKIFGDPFQPAITRLMHKQTVSLYDPDLRQRFRNNDLGLPFSEEGNRVTDNMMERAVRDYTPPFRITPDRPFEYNTIPIAWSVAGVDVGSTLHVQISGVIKIEHQFVRLKLWVGQVGEFEDLDDLVKRYNVTSGVIDAMPETRKAREFCRAHKGWWICWYNKAASKKEMLRNDKDKEISLNRTEALDSSLAEWDAGLVYHPANWRALDGGLYREQIQDPTRFIDPKTEAAVWEKCEDHHRHADTYERFAMRLPGAAQWGGMKV